MRYAARRSPPSRTMPAGSSRPSQTRPATSPASITPTRPKSSSPHRSGRRPPSPSMAPATHPRS
jgi:hypothetical protein